MIITTLQIADRIAEAVVAAGTFDRFEQQLVFDKAECAQAVLRTMREHSVWFCRVQQDADGVIDAVARSGLVDCLCIVAIVDNCPVHGHRFDQKAVR